MAEAEVNGCHSGGSLLAEALPSPPLRLQTPILPVSCRPASSTAGLLFRPPGVCGFPMEASVASWSPVLVWADGLSLLSF